MQPTAQAAGRKWSENEPQRGEREATIQTPQEGTSSHAASEVLRLCLSATLRGISHRTKPMMKRLGWLLLGGLLVFGYSYVRENPKQKLLGLLRHLPQADPTKPEGAQPGQTAPSES